ncbi:hypothetical protein [Janthinobacterium sp. B9-8]|uniref:hypothetical protein n=1 Tax=Janthinobacterium sp. B9-8 TaxID=1236179 RepID=UPI00061CE4ED|nr:hypothetical protein [Janthinobacterium sp. B9-8]AMC35427.1 hypothetical protein VN23_12790 [Janthinobacterium sp. B9-8]
MSTLESQVADLVTATTALTGSVNDRMDQVVAIAKAKVVEGKTITNSTLDACLIGLSNAADGAFKKLNSEQLITGAGRGGVYLTRGTNLGDYAELTFGINASARNLGRGAGIRSARVNMGSGGNDGDLVFYTSNGTADGVADAPMAMRLDQAGNLLLGIGSASCHVLYKSVPEGVAVAQVFGAGSNVTAEFRAVTALGINAANAGVLLGKNSVTGRSLNAGGTLNASGADYAEYEYKAATCAPVLAGQIIGFDAGGLITDQFSKAVTFAIKSTNPSIVGGDSWGDENVVGLKPQERPVPELPALRMEPQSPAPDQFDGDINMFHSAISEYHEDHLLWLSEQAEHACLLEAENLRQAKAVQDYEAELAVWDAKLEAARANVDRIAYCGKVPVLLAGAKLGDYLLPVTKGAGISGRWVSSADIDQVPGDYRQAIGQVRKVLNDGTAIVVVKPI